MNRRGFLGSVLAAAAMVAVSRFVPTPALRWPKWSEPESRTLFVDGRYAGAPPSDGSRERPFRTLREAIDDAWDGAGDVIQAVPGHAEWIDEHSPIVIDKSNLTIRYFTFEYAT